MTDTDRDVDRPPLLAGWSGLALLRLGLAGAIGAYALTYHPPDGVTAPAYARPAVLAVASVLAVLAVLQLTPSRRGSRALATLGFTVDAIAVLGILVAFSFDPRRTLLALVIVVQAEGGALLGIGGGLGAWAMISAGYLGVEFLGAGRTGTSLEPMEVGVRIGAGLLVALGGAFLSEEISGERDRRARERDRELQRLQTAESQYRSLVEQIPVVTYVDALDRSSSTLFMSPQIREIAGYSPEEWTEDPQLWPRVIHPEDRAWVLAESERTNRTGEPFKAEYRLITKDHGVVWVRDEAILVRDRQGRARYWQGVIVDITEQKRAEEEVTYLAYHDRLTDLPNRIMFDTALDLALARARRKGLAVAVLYVDLDNFKDVNDTLGHGAGDVLLRRIGERLESAVRATDVVARHGGDEFLVLLADLETEDASAPPPLQLAETVAGRIHEALRAPFEVDGRSFLISASIGVSSFPTDGTEPQDLLRVADEAMYRAKRGGPGSTGFSERTAPV